MKGKIDMEERYRAALEIILAMCEEENYLKGEDLKLICKTALKEREEKRYEELRDIHAI